MTPARSVIDAPRLIELENHLRGNLRGDLPDTLRAVLDLAWSQVPPRDTLPPIDYGWRRLMRRLGRARARGVVKVRPEPGRHVYGIVTVAGGAS